MALCKGDVYGSSYFCIIVVRASEHIEKAGPVILEILMSGFQTQHYGP